MCENGICSAVKRGKNVWKYAVYQQYRHCDVFTSNSLCLTPTLSYSAWNIHSRIYEFWNHKESAFHQFNCTVLTLFRVFPHVSLFCFLLSVQCHACAAIQTAEALDRGREEGRRLHRTAPGCPQQPCGGGWAAGAPGNNTPQRLQTYK